MRQKYTKIPEVTLEDVDHFYVLGSQYDDGILGQANLKLDLKAAFYGGETGEFVLDLSSYEYPTSENPKISFSQKIPFPYQGDTIKVKEPDGNVYEYDVKMPGVVRGLPFMALRLQLGIVYSPDGINFFIIDASPVS